MKKNYPNGSQFKVDYFNLVATSVMTLIITIGITRPLSGESFFILLKQLWFYGPFGGTLAAMSYLFLIIESVTRKLDRHWRWEERFAVRMCLQVVLACIAPTIIIAFASWLYFRVLNTTVMLHRYDWSMFLILLAISLFINLSYALYYFYQFLRHLALTEKKEAEPLSFILVPNGKGQMKISITDIAYIYTESNAVFLRTLSGINYLLEQSLDEMTNTLDPNQFIKISRTFIISSASYISWKEYPTKRMLLTLTPPANLPVIVSRRKVAGTKQWIEKNNIN